MNEIYELVKNCDKCPNLMHCKKYNMEPAVMDHPNAKILFIAQNPGVPLENERGQSYEEVLINSRQGKLFVSKFLALSKLKYEDILWSNVVKCASIGNREITQDEMDNCFPILQKQIDSLPNLEYVILLGKITQDYIQTHPIKTSAKIIKFFHPAYIFRTGNFELIDDLVSKLELYSGPVINGTQKLNIMNNGNGNGKTETILMQTKFNDIYRFYRDVKGIKKCAKTEFDNYFYVLETDKESVLQLIKENQLDDGLSVDERLYTSIYGENVVKITPDKFMFWKIKRLMKGRKIRTFEFDIDVYLKYLSTFKPKFSKTRKLGIIDIETDMSKDAYNAPKPITAITVYNYEDNNYYVWVLRNRKKQIPEKRIHTNEILFFFENEKIMMDDFVEKFRSFDFDIVGGWYSNDFDWPYIMNRLKILGIDINRLSNFGEASVRPWEMNKKIYFDTIIYGVELVDFIPVLQKNTCYQAQPASWSLESVSKFYLQKEKLVEIGAESWNENINDFIAYNLRDVELVKELIDKFKLMDFLLVIQNEIVEIPLKHTTHNSMVLMHYLKKNYSDIIIPDNNGEIKISDETININEHYIKIKAAHVIEAKSGIYHNVSIFDFAGLYPTIFRTFNISPDTINENEGVSIDDIVIWKLLTPASDSAIEKEFVINKLFKQDFEGIYPKLLKIFMDKKEFHKQRKKEFTKLYGESDIRTTLELFRSDVFKQIANSLYGVGGFNRFSIFRPEVSAAVTSMSRKLLNFIEEYVAKKDGFKPLYGDTDSVMIRHPKNVSPQEFEKEINVKIKEYILNTFKITNENYCLNFEYANKTFTKFVMKNAKKKYYGILENGKFYVKGFDIVQHSISNKIKDILQEIYTKLVNGCSTDEIRLYLKETKKRFMSFKPDDLGKEWKIAKDLEEYDTNIQHIRAARYSNKYLKTNFRGGSTGKLLFIKEVLGYPTTDVIFIDSDTKIPKEFKLDYDKMWEKLILDKIKLLDDIEEMHIEDILNPNKTLEKWI